MESPGALILLLNLLRLLGGCSCYPFTDVHDNNNKQHRTLFPGYNCIYEADCGPCPVSPCLFEIPCRPCTGPDDNPLPPITTPLPPTAPSSVSLGTWLDFPLARIYVSPVLTGLSWHVAEARSISLGGKLLEIRKGALKASKETLQLLKTLLRAYNGVPIWFGANRLADGKTWSWASDGSKVNISMELGPQGECGEFRLEDGVVMGLPAKCNDPGVPHGFVSVVLKKPKGESNTEESSTSSPGSPSSSTHTPPRPDEDTSQDTIPSPTPTKQPPGIIEEPPSPV